MFEKLLSQLPYNPGLAHQVSFYSRRMREEASIRRTGLVFIFLAFFVQCFAVLNPPQPSVAASNNDLIYGGISSAGDAANKCQNNIQHFKNILDNYGITCAQVANANTVNISSSGQNYYSFGRHQQGFNSEQAVNIPNVGTIFIRKLSDWGPNVSYKALQLSATSGKTFWILYDCANLVSIGIPNPYNPVGSIGNNQPVSKPAPAPAPKPTPAPASGPTPPTITTTPTPPQNCDALVSSENPYVCLAPRKTAANTTQGLADANDTTAQAGDTIVYTLYVQNTGKKTAKDYVFQENLSDVLDYANVSDLHGGIIGTDGVVAWPKVTIEGGKTASKQITVKVKDPVPQTPVSGSDPKRFDLVMTNIFGNTVNINLPGSPGKTVEAAGTTLPNTGPGSTLIIGGLILVGAGYFYSRSRLLAKESNLALQESSA